MELDSLLDIVSAVNDIAKTGNEVLSLVNNVKKALKNENSGAMNLGQGNAAIPRNIPLMANFNSQMANPYGQGNQWLPNLKNIAMQNGDSWVPEQTQAFLGINLTGIWITPAMYNYQAFFRQFGPYINIVGVFAGIPCVFAEGIFDPVNRIVHAVGQNTYYGVPFESRGQLFPNWTIQGTMSWMNQFGFNTQMPYYMVRFA